MSVAFSSIIVCSLVSRRGPVAPPADWYSARRRTAARIVFARKPSRLTTVRRNVDQSHEVTAYCHCGHGAVLDLKALLEAGYGETELVDLPLRCPACGEKGHRITISCGHATGY